MGVGSAWGSREEMLHPRDSHGRFRSSWKMAEGVVDKIMAILDRFNPKTFQSQDQANQYVRSLATRNRQTYKPDIDSFLRDYSKVNGDLRAGKPNKTVDEMRRIMQPLPDDVIVTRTGPPSIVGLDPANVGNAEELTGKLVRDKGFWAANIGGPLPHQDGNITFTMAVPKGTKALAPSTSKPNGELIFEPEQPFRITEVNPDGKGGFFVYAVATGDSEGESPVDIAKAVPEAGVPEAPAAAPQAPAAPGGAAPGTGDLGAPLSRKPGRPAGPPPAARNDGHVADNVGGGQAPEPSSARANTPEPAPSTPEAPGTPPAPELPATPEAGPDARATFRDAFDKADLKVPTVGTRRKQFMDGYNGVASGKKTPQEAVNDLDNAISANKKIIETDKADGTDSGPLPEDVKRLEALRDLIAEHFNFTGRKKFKESSGKAPSTPAKKAAPSPVATQAEAPAAAKAAPAEKPEVTYTYEYVKPGFPGHRNGVYTIEKKGSDGSTTHVKSFFQKDKVKADKFLKQLNDEEKAKRTPAKKAAPERLIPGMAAGKTNAGRVKVGERILVTQNKDGTWSSSPTKSKNATAITVTGKSAATERGRSRTVIHGKDDDGNEISVRSAPSHQTFWVAPEKGGKKEAPAAPKKSTAEVDAEIARKERDRKAQIRKEMRAEREARGETPKKAEAPKLTPEQEAKLEADRKVEAARTETIAKSLERSREPKKAVPPPARPQIPAKDLSDKGLMQRFEAEIKKDNPDEARLKELGDELDRRDLETKNRVQGLTDDDLESKFQDEIRKDNPDEEEMRRLGDELDRRDKERADKERKIEDLVAKGRDYRDAWAEVNGKDPSQLDLEERNALLDQSRRAGESRETTLRRLYQEHVHRQYLDAERVTRGHLLTPEGRSKGIDPKSLFQGSNVNANRYASDELKEYWQDNPRKTFLQYKADTLGRKQDIEGAKKTEGVARNLELGERLTRKSPAKKALPAPPKEEKAPEAPAAPTTGPKNIKEMLESPATSAETKKVIQEALADTEVPAGRPGIERMTIPQLREEAKLQGKRIPSNVRRKADIVDFLKGGGTKGDSQAIRESTKGALEKQMGAPEIASVDDARAELNKSTIANLRKAAEDHGIDVPKSARLKKDVVEAIIQGLAQKELDRRGGGKPEVKAPEAPNVAEAKPEWGTLKSHGVKNGDIVIYHGSDRRGGPGISRRARVSTEAGGYTLREPDTNKVITSFGAAHRGWFSPDNTPNENLPEAPSAPEVPKRIGEPGTKGLHAMTIAEMRKHADENGIQIPRALKKKNEITNWLADALVAKERGEEPIHVPTQREIRRNNNAARARLREMDRKGKLTQEEFEAEGRGVVRGSAKVIYGDDLKKRFDGMKTSQEGDDFMVSMDPSRQELLDMAKSLNIAHKASANKQELKDNILHWGLRRRLQSEAVSRPGPTGGARVLKNAMERPGPKRSTKPKIENTWGVPGGEVNFHEDGNIGSTLQGLAHSGDSDLLVNGDRLDNTLGKEATKLVRGDITQTELIDKLRSMSVQLDGNGSPEAARLLRRAADRMDSPEIKRPELPEGTPEPIQKLMDRLVDTPLARSSGPGGRDNEVQALTKLMDDWRDGKVSAVGLPMKIREATFNRRHESNEGKFQIDRAVNEAVQEIEDMGRKDRNLLRPPSRRAEHANQPLPQRVPREALKSDLSDASMPELRAVAESEGVQVPGSMRSKAEVAKYLTDVRQEKSKLNAVPELKGQPETLDRMRALKEAMKDEPDSRIAPSWGDAPDMIMSNAIQGLEDGSLDNPMVSRMLADIDGFVPKDSPLRQLIKDARNDLDDIYINAQGGKGGNIGPEKYHVGSTQGLESLIHDVTPEALSNPKTKRERISTGQVGANAKVTLPNGKPVFEKTSKRVGYRSGESSSDAEQLLPAIGTALGGPTMPTMRMSPDTIYTDWVHDYTPGQSIISDISDTPNPGMEEIWARLKDSREGKILGLMDMITFNGDRHGSNWGIDGDGKLVAIDNGMGWGFTDFEEISPGVDLMKIDLEENVFPNLADRFSMLGFFDEDTDGLKNPNFTIADMEKVRARLEALRDQFRHLGREQWLDLSLKAVDILKRYATGTVDLIE